MVLEGWAPLEFLVARMLHGMETGRCHVAADSAPCASCPSGRYRSYVAPDLRRHTAPVTFTTKRDAEGWLEDERRRIESGTWRPEPVRAAVAITVASYAASWLSDRDLKPRSRVEYQRLLDGVIRSSPLGELPVAAVTPAVVRQWYAALNAGTPTRRAHSYQFLRAVLNTAVDDSRSRPTRAGSGAPGRPSGCARSSPRPPPSWRRSWSTPRRSTGRWWRWPRGRRCGSGVDRASAGRRRPGRRGGALPAVSAGAGRDRRRQAEVDGFTAVRGHSAQRAPPGARTLAQNVTGRRRAVFPGVRGGHLGPGSSLSNCWHPAGEAAGRNDLRFQT